MWGRLLFSWEMPGPCATVMPADATSTYTGSLVVCLLERTSHISLIQQRRCQVFWNPLPENGCLNWFCRLSSPDKCWQCPMAWGSLSHRTFLNGTDEALTWQVWVQSHMWLVDISGLITLTESTEFISPGLWRVICCVYFSLQHVEAYETSPQPSNSFYCVMNYPTSHILYCTS